MISGRYTCILSSCSSLTLRSMKQAAYILTILMLFFMAQPFLVNCQAQVKPVSKITGCCGGNSCHKKSKDEKAPVKDCDRTNACNPFAGCSQCQYIPTSKFTYPLRTVNSISEKIAISSENIQAGYSNDCWHPPKFILV